RPLHYLWYAAVAGGLGVLAGLLITVFAGAIVYLSLWFASWTAGGASTARIAARLPQGIVGINGFTHDAPVVAVPVAPGNSNRPATYVPAPENQAPLPTVSTTPITVVPGPAPVAIAGSNESESGVFRAGVAVLGFWLAAVQVLLLGFGFSYFWTATTGIYLLLRYDVDATEMDVVHLEDEPAVFGLPPLETDEAGVAVVSAEESAASGAHGDETTSAGTTSSSQSATSQ
ncbi:MAG: hypothetical protein AB7U73_22685, partial [Pirellulales bacterium]